MNDWLLPFCKCGCGQRVKWEKANYRKGHCLRNPEILEKVMKHHRGAKRSLETRKKMSAWQIGRKLPKSTIEKVTKWRREHPQKYWLGKKMPIEMRKKMSLSRKGKLNSNWKGGISTLINNLRTCEKYQKWRTSIYERDNYTCQKCFQEGNGNLEAHHSPEISKILLENNIDTIEQALLCEKLWYLDIGTTFCQNCHHIVHGRKF